ncbi:MAG: hypothetical protein ACK4SY_00400 [Pyrobaculum sp.]
MWHHSGGLVGSWKPLPTVAKAVGEVYSPLLMDPRGRLERKGGS